MGRNPGTVVSGQGSFDKIIAKGVKHHLCGQPGVEDITTFHPSPCHRMKEAQFTAWETEAQSSHGKLALGPQAQCLRLNTAESRTCALDHSVRVAPQRDSR